MREVAPTTTLLFLQEVLGISLSHNRQELFLYFPKHCMELKCAVRTFCSMWKRDM